MRANLRIMLHRQWVIVALEAHASLNRYVCAKLED